MRQRRETPYSKMEEIHANRGELLALVLVTLVLGVLLGLLTDALYAWLDARLTEVVWQRVMFSLGGILVLALGMLIAWLFFGRPVTQKIGIEMTVPYRLNYAAGQNRLTVVLQPDYPLTRYARQAVMRHLPPRSQEVVDWLEGWRAAKEANQLFQLYSRPLHAELSQCLLLYVLHFYGDQSLGRSARYGFGKVDLPAVAWKMDDLPPPLRDNPFLRADNKPEEWRLLLPAGVDIDLVPVPNSDWPRWELRHKRYGALIIHWSPAVSVDGERRLRFRLLTRRMPRSRSSEVYLLTNRFHAEGRFRWTLWPGSDPFHHWATTFLARVEEALDWDYYLQTRPSRILGDLDWKIGWVTEGDSIVDTLARIERRLDDLEMGSIRDEK